MPSSTVARGAQVVLQRTLNGITGIRGKIRREFQVLFAIYFFWFDLMFFFRFWEKKWSFEEHFLQLVCSITKMYSCYSKRDSTLTKSTVAWVGVVSCYECLGDVLKYYYGIKKHSKEPFNIKIDSFQPGSMLVVLSWPITWPGKTNKAWFFVQPHDLKDQ